MSRTTISVFEIYVYQVTEHSLLHYWESFQCRATISNVQDMMTLWLILTWHNITRSSLCACVLANMNESWVILYIHAYDTLHVLIFHTNSLASSIVYIYLHLFYVASCISPFVPTCLMCTSIPSLMTIIFHDRHCVRTQENTQHMDTSW